MKSQSNSSDEKKVYKCNLEVTKEAMYQLQWLNQ